MPLGSKTPEGENPEVVGQNLTGENYDIWLPSGRGSFFLANRLIVEQTVKVQQEHPIIIPQPVLFTPATERQSNAVILLPQYTSEGRGFTPVSHENLLYLARKYELAQVNVDLDVLLQTPSGRLDEDNAHNILTDDVLRMRRDLRKQEEEVTSEKPQEKRTSLRLLGRDMPGIDNMREFVSRHPRVRAIAGAAAVLLIFGGNTLALVALGDKMPVVHAESPKSAGNGILNDPSFFVYQGKQNEWRGDNTRFGFGFNDADRAVGTFDKYVERIYQSSDQLFQGYYLETAQGNGIRIATGGIIVKPELNKSIIIVMTTDNRPELVHPAGAEIWDLRDTHNLNLRIYIPRTGFPVSTLGDSYDSFADGIDVKGYYIEAGLVRSVNPAENGKYRHYFNASYIPVGDWIWMPQYKLYLPSVFRNLSQ